jgi:hypothetical protein
MVITKLSYYRAQWPILPEWNWAIRAESLTLRLTDWALQLAQTNFSQTLMHVGGQNVYYNVRPPHLALRACGHNIRANRRTVQANP